MILRMISIYTDTDDQQVERDVNALGRFIEKMYLLCLPRIDNQYLGKLSISLQSQHEDIQIVKGFKDSPVFEVIKEFDYRGFSESPLDQKRKILLGEIDSSFKVLCKKMNWDYRPFERAHSKVLQLDFQYNFIFEPLKYSRDRKHKAAIEASFKDETITVSILFLDPQDRIVRRCSVSTLDPPVGNYQYFLGKRNWIDNNRYQLFTIDETKRFVASVESGEVLTETFPADTNKTLRAAYYSREHKLFNPPSVGKEVVDVTSGS